MSCGCSRVKKVSKPKPANKPVLKIKIDASKTKGTSK